MPRTTQATSIDHDLLKKQIKTLTSIIVRNDMSELELGHLRGIRQLLEAITDYNLILQFNPKEVKNVF